MTDLYRLFDVETRSLRGDGRVYAGQRGDSASCTVHFSYSDESFLLPDLDGGRWIPYIVFDVPDGRGGAAAYGPDSTPRFDGFEFTIPWDIVTRVRDGKLGYQLCFSRTEFAVDARGVAKVTRDASNILSRKDLLVFRDSVDRPPREPGPCAPIPGVEPSVAAMIRMFREYGIVIPVTAEVNPATNRIEMRYRTYEGDTECTVTLDVPYLDEKGKVRDEFLPLVNDWNFATDYNVPSANMVREGIQVLDAKKVDRAQVVPYWGQPPTNHTVPTEKLVKDSLDSKFDKKELVCEWSDPLTECRAPSERLVHDTIMSVADTKTDKVMAIPAWDASETYGLGSTVLYGEAIYISRHEGNVGNDPDVDNYWWVAVKGGSDGTGRTDVFTTMVGDGSSTSCIVEHGLGTMNFYPVLRTNTPKPVFVEATVIAVDENHAQLVFTSPPPYNGVVVTLTPGDRTRSAYIGTIGNGTDSEYWVTHNLGMYDYYWALRDTFTGEYVKATVVAVNPTQAKFVFGGPIGTDAVTVMIAPCVGVDWEGRWVHGQDIASDEWVIYHDLGRMVSVQVFDSCGREMEGEITQRVGPVDCVRIKFNEPVTGCAILNRGDLNGYDTYIRGPEPSRRPARQVQGGERRQRGGLLGTRRDEGEDGRLRRLPLFLRRRELDRPRRRRRHPEGDR